MNEKNKKIFYLLTEADIWDIYERGAGDELMSNTDWLENFIKSKNKVTIDLDDYKTIVEWVEK
ncbi:MAG: hypothetical protein WDA59_11060 [Methanofastidiosum sp.]|jgi:hypothetical protein